MQLSPSFRGVILSLIFAGVAPLFSIAQGSYPAAGGESAVAGALPGDQVRPHAAINSSGGFIVWEDTYADPYGMGLKAAALDQNLSRVGSPFRVNKNGAGEQEHPRVALLNGGGAVFVWQGGRPGFQHVYARFLSAANVWVTDDIQVNTFAKNSQTRPDVAVLTNGNVVVVWSSLNQATASSLQDVYAQILSPSGQKIGSEIAVNASILYNQRSPSVAALADGGFVVTWISEMQRVTPIIDPATGLEITNRFSVATRPSVDVNARIFDTNGIPSTAMDLLVNTGNDPCDSPAIAAATNGGFMVAWAQRDMLNRSNSWDVFVRPFNEISSGIYAGGASGAVNTQLYGDQYLPAISAVGTDFLVVWTSLGQDGSREGVYGTFLQSDGAASSAEFRVNDTVASSQMHPACASDTTGRFLVAWTSFEGASSFDIYTRKYISPARAPGATSISYAPPPLEAFNDTPVIVSNEGPPKIEPPAPPSGAGESNHVGFVNATYCGLFYDETNGVSSATAGSISISVTALGNFSAKLNLGGKNYSASGRLDGFGHASARISRAILRALDVDLQLDLSQKQITGTVSDGHWIASLVANRTISSMAAGGTKSAPAYAGSYTMDLPGAGMTSISPVGDSFGTVKVDASGNVSWAVSLADGTKVTQKTTMTQNGICPLYLPLYAGGGSAIGWIQFGTNGFDGQIVWIRQAGAVGKYYPAGFTNQVEVTGSIYQKPSSGARALDWNNGSGMMLLSGGGLAAPSATPISVAPNNHLASSADPTLKLTLSSSSGLFTGSFVSPSTGKKVSFQGALFPNRKLARGYFIDASQSGQISLEGAP